MTLKERLEQRRHAEHSRRGEVLESCPLCPKDQRSEWLRRGAGKDLTEVTR